MCDSITITLSPYLAEIAPHARPPMPLPMTTTSYSPSSPPSPLPVPGYVGFSYFGSSDMSYENVMTSSRFVSVVCATFLSGVNRSSCVPTIEGTAERHVGCAGARSGPRTVRPRCKSDDSSVAMELMACELARAPTCGRAKEEGHCRREIAIFDPSAAPPSLESTDPRWRAGQPWACAVQRAL